MRLQLLDDAPRCSRTESASGWARMVHTKVATIPWAPSENSISRFPDEMCPVALPTRAAQHRGDGVLETRVGGTRLVRPFSALRLLEVRDRFSGVATRGGVNRRRPPHGQPRTSSRKTRKSSSPTEYANRHVATASA